jgi:CFEM domain
MYATAFLSIFLAISVAAFPGFLYDEPHHTHEVLDNIHQTPRCAHTCIFDETYHTRFAPECGGLEGLELGACFCHANAYQYIVDKCFERKCSSNERKKVIPRKELTNLRHER